MSVQLLFTGIGAVIHGTASIYIFSQGLHDAMLYYAIPRGYSTAESNVIRYMARIGVPKGGFCTCRASRSPKMMAPCSLCIPIVSCTST